MLIVPFIVGVVLRSRAGEPGGAWLIPLAAAEFAAYFAFNALGLWLHAAPARRAGFRPALITYTAITAVTAVLVIVLGGRPLLGRVPAAPPPVGRASWRASPEPDPAGPRFADVLRARHPARHAVDRFQRGP